MQVIETVVRIVSLIFFWSATQLNPVIHLYCQAVGYPGYPTPDLDSYRDHKARRGPQDSGKHHNPVHNHVVLDSAEDRENGIAVLVVARMKTVLQVFASSRLVVPARVARLEQQAMGVPARVVRVQPAARSTPVKKLLPAAMAVIQISGPVHADPV